MNVYFHRKTKIKTCSCLNLGKILGYFIGNSTNTHLCYMEQQMIQEEQLMAQEKTWRLTRRMTIIPSMDVTREMDSQGIHSPIIV